MYNGIGLQTARGSGTNGYVQRNLSFVRVGNVKLDYKTEEEIRRFESEYNKAPNQDILEHQRKRKIEVECLELEEKLVDEGLTEDEITKRVGERRQELLDKMKKSFDNRQEFILEFLQSRSVKETHQLAEINQDRNDKLKSALGISENFVAGSSMDIIRQAKEKQAAREVVVKASKEPQSMKSKPVDEPTPKQYAKRSRSSSDSSDSSSESDSSDSSSSDSSSSSSSESDSDSEGSSYKRKRKSRKSTTKHGRYEKSDRHYSNKGKNSSESRVENVGDSKSKHYRDESRNKSTTPPKRKIPSFISTKHQSSAEGYSRSKSPAYNRESKEQGDKYASHKSDYRNRDFDSKNLDKHGSRDYSRRVNSSNSREKDHPPKDRASSRNHSDKVRSHRRHSSHSHSGSPKPRGHSRENDSKKFKPSRSSSSSSNTSSSSSSDSSDSEQSRSPSIPRRRGSPTFLDKRRITSARKRPIPYKRNGSSSSPEVIQSNSSTPFLYR